MKLTECQRLLTQGALSESHPMPEGKPEPSPSPLLTKKNTSDHIPLKLIMCLEMNVQVLKGPFSFHVAN